MYQIKQVKARQVYDSRGIPTVEAEIFLSSNAHGRFIAPSGASCGSKEALELRDNDQNNFLGKGVVNALSHVLGEISKAITEKSFADQGALDKTLIDLDGTKNKSRLGANAILSVSGAFFHACAEQDQTPLYKFQKTSAQMNLPVPLINVINGGAHANNNLDIQEFMLVPVSAPTFREALKRSAEVFYALKNLLKKNGHSTAVGDEGGFAPNFSNNQEALEHLCIAVENAGYKIGDDFKFALDVAASEFFHESNSLYEFNGEKISREQLLDWYETFCKKFPICSIEDPFFEQDFDGFKQVTKKLGNKVQIVGDDLFVTNTELIQEGIEQKWANAVLIKMNQIGTISETLQAISLTKNANFKPIISHRSGESEDTTIADLAVLTGAPQIKTGSMSRSERMAKYNQLLRIEEALGKNARYFGENAFA